jgi:two-component system phosphate regulon sensor histidine kinase PhoR
MKKDNRKNYISTVLMTTSILLLVLLQFFWLRNSYNNAYADLRKEANTIFRSTATSMWDSLLSTSIRSVPFDSLPVPRGMFRNGTDSAIAIARIENNVIRRGERDSSSVKVIFSTRDSALPRDVLKPLMSRWQQRGDHNPNHTFIIQMNADTLDRRRLEDKLTHAFIDNGIEADLRLRVKTGSGLPPGAELLDLHPETIRRKRPAEPKQNEAAGPNQIVTESVSFGPLKEYSIELNNIRPLMLKRIAAEIFFSLILTATIATAFAFMYRNIRSQQRLVLSKNEFINNVTHELKTPVATVSVALEAIQNFNASDNPALAKEYLEIARRELTRLNDITDRILRTSVLDNEIAITKERCDFDDLIRKVISDKKIIFEQRSARVQYEKSGSDFSLQCDPYQLYQMIENLVDNALKYSPDMPVLTINLDGSEAALVFTISDEGIGIPAEYQDKIFEKFFRVPSGDVHNIKGYGLGLSYVDNLVRSLGGSIALQSAIEKGTTFKISFPRIKIRRH